MANRVHPTAVIGAGVELGADNVIGPYAVIVGPATIGAGNWIGPHTTIGTPAAHTAAPHPAAWDEGPSGDPTADGHGVVIGDGNRIREYCSVHQGTARPTTVGSGCYLLRGSHVAHDCVVGDRVTLGSNAVLGGHVAVWSWATLGLGAVVHQRVRIGPGAMVGMGAAVRDEVAAFAVSAGVPARVTGTNTVGLTRMGAAEPAIAAFPAGIGDDVPVDRADLPDDVAAVLDQWRRRSSG